MELFNRKLSIIVILATELILLSVLGTTTSVASADEPSYDNLVEIKQTEVDDEGNIYVVGETEKEDIYIAKIDPNGDVVWEDTFGGENKDTAKKLLFDKLGNLYLVGLTFSVDFNTTDNALQLSFGGKSDYFIRKWDSTGLLLWSTYLGGSDAETMFGKVDPFRMTSNNELIILGWTNSNDFPLKNEFQSTNKGSPYSSDGLNGDMFITKISGLGEIMWSSYFGSSDIDFAEVFFDSEENLILRGNDNHGNITDSLLPGGEFKGTRDPYIVKINQNGELLFSQYYGGRLSDFNWWTAIDGQDNIITLGATSSTDFPIKNAIQSTNGGGSIDLFITKFDPDGNIIFSTYFGGSENDAFSTRGFSIDDQMIIDNPKLRIDSEDNIVFMTRTGSSDIPQLHPIVNEKVGTGVDSFVGKLAPNGTLLYGSYFDSILIDAIVGENNDVFITGQLISQDWPIIGSSSQSVYGGGNEIGYAILDSNNTLIKSSFLGGSGSDRLVKGYSTQNGNYLILGTTESDDLPNSLNDYGGGMDIFLCSISSNGVNEWCRYVGGSLREGINGVGLVFQPDGEYVLLGTTRSDDLSGTPDTPSFDQAAFAMRFDESGKEVWTSIVLAESRIQEEEPEPDNTVKIIVASLVVSLLIAGLYYLRVLSLKSKGTEYLLLNEKMTTILSPIFNNQPQLIHIFGATKVFSDKKTADEIIADIPTEILDFKYFLHPVRLSIVKLLDENMHLTTVQIREALDITWSELSTHLGSLKKRGYITINQEFVDGITRSVISAESSVISQFYSLKEIVLEFFDATPNLEKYLEQVTAVKMRSEDPDLYPNNH